MFALVVSKLVKIPTFTFNFEILATPVRGSSTTVTVDVEVSSPFMESGVIVIIPGASIEEIVVFGSNSNPLE